MKNGKLSGLLNSPTGIVITVGAVVLTAEFLYMSFHRYIETQFNISVMVMNFLDAFTVTLVVAPLLYFLVFRRMQGDVERHRQINAAALNAIIIVDEQGRITDWNPAAERMFQYSREEAVGQPLHQLLVPLRYRDEAERGFARFQETGSGPVIGKVTEISALCKDGSEFPVELSISAARLQGRWHAVGVIRDLTERKRAEELVSAQHAEIERARQDWKAVFDSITHPVFLHDGEFRVIRANRAYAEQARKPFNEIIGQPYYTLFPKSDSPLPCCLRAMEKAEEEEEEEEEVMVGEAIYRSRTFSVRSEQNVYLYSVHILEDITERKRTEAALRDNEQRFHHLFENMSSGVAVYQPDAACEVFTFKSVNYALERIERIKREEVLGRSAEEVFPGIRAFGLLEVFKRVCRSGVAEPFPAAFYRDERISGWRENYVYRLDSGEIVAVYDDVTERKQAEQKELEAGVLLKDALEDAIGAIAATLEQRDPYTAGHQRRVAQLAAAIAEEMGLSREVIEGIHFGGMIHDLGKISVPAEILGKPGRLTDVELGLIEVHAEAGYQIVKGIAFPWPVADMVYQHHERLDGSGYPQGLKGDEVMLEARILAVADVVEAMSANRPYRPGFGMGAALDEITRVRGTQLDVRAVDACLRVIREKGFVFAQ